MAPKSQLQAGVILRAAEEIPHQLPEYWAAAHELNHTSGEGAAQQFARADGIEKAFAREGIDPRGCISDQRPVLSDNVSFGKRALLRRRQDVTVKLGALRLYAVLLHEGLQMAAQLHAGMRRHTAANAHREVIAARERPDIAFKMRQELDGDGVAGLRHEIALRHLQLVAL